jgi:hypothetical protein
VKDDHASMGEQDVAAQTSKQKVRNEKGKVS